MSWLAGMAGKAATNGYVILAVAVAIFAGLWKWEQRKVERAELAAKGLERSLAQAEKEITDTAAIAKHNKDVADSFKSYAEEQMRERRALEKKSADRLRENNDLRRKISNVPTDQNVPVSNHIESVLDAQRVRGAVSGGAGADGDGDKARGSEAADPAGRDLSATPSPTS
jgi:phage repressor protein C with HTH and peptisase S24 domain